MQVVGFVLQTVHLLAHYVQTDDPVSMYPGWQGHLEAALLVRNETAIALQDRQTAAAEQVSQ